MQLDTKIDQFFSSYFSSRVDSALEQRSPQWKSALLETGVLDSFGIVELISEIETNFSIKIEDTEVTLNNFNSISAMTSLIKQKLG